MKIKAYITHSKWFCVNQYFIICHIYLKMERQNRNAQLTNIQRGSIINLYKSGRSITEISNQLGISVSIMNRGVYDKTYIYIIKTGSILKFICIL